MIIECLKCGKIWDYKGKSIRLATCPQCLLKVKVIEYAGKIEGERQ